MRFIIIDLDNYLLKQIGVMSKKPDFYFHFYLPIYFLSPLFLSRICGFDLVSFIFYFTHPEELVLILIVGVSLLVTNSFLIFRK